MSKYQLQYQGKNRNIGYIEKGLFFKAIYPKNVFRNLGQGAIGFNADLFFLHILNRCHTIKIQLQGYYYSINVFEAEERCRCLQFDNGQVQVFIELVYFTKSKRQTKQHGSIKKVPKK